MTDTVQIVRVRYPGTSPDAARIVEKYRRHLAAAFPSAPWQDADRLPRAAGNALYLLYVGVAESESPARFTARFGAVDPDVCARTVVEMSIRGDIWKLMREFRFAAAWGFDYGLIGRLDVMREVDPDYERAGPQRLDDTWVAPDYTLIPNDAETIAGYFAALLADLTHGREYP